MELNNGYYTAGAEFSPDKKYRYVLWRIWDDSKPIAMCIGLNPSNANAEKDDPTIRILTDTLKHLEYGGFKMTNLYALVSSDPKKLSDVPDPIGHNDQWLQTIAHTCQEIVFCWGNFKQASYRAKIMKGLFPDAKCFGKTKQGHPIHPMAIMYQGMKKDQIKLSHF